MQIPIIIEDEWIIAEPKHEQTLHMKKTEVEGS